MIQKKSIAIRKKQWLPAAIPEEEVSEELSVLFHPALPPAVGEVKHHPVKHSTLEGGHLLQLCAVHLKQHSSSLQQTKNKKHKQQIKKLSW